MQKQEKKYCACLQKVVLIRAFIANNLSHTLINVVNYNQTDYAKTQPTKLRKEGKAQEI